MQDLIERHVDHVQAQRAHLVVDVLVLLDCHHFAAADALHVAAVLVHVLAGHGDQFEVATLQHLQVVVGQLVDASQRHLQGPRC